MITVYSEGLEEYKEKIRKFFINAQKIDPRTILIKGKELAETDSDALIDALFRAKNKEEIEAVFSYMAENEPYRSRMSHSHFFSADQQYESFPERFLLR